MFAIRSADIAHYRDFRGIENRAMDVFWGFLPTTLDGDDRFRPEMSALSGASASRAQSKRFVQVRDLHELTTVL
jgi:hypothetical protein